MQAEHQTLFQRRLAELCADMAYEDNGRFRRMALAHFEALTSEDWDEVETLPPALAVSLLLVRVFAGMAEAVLADERRGQHDRFYAGVWRKLSCGLDGQALGEADLHEVDTRGAIVAGLYRALGELRGHEPRVHEVLCLRFFSGMNLNEIAQTLPLSMQQVRRIETRGLAFLKQKLNPSEAV